MRAGILGVPVSFGAASWDADALESNLTTEHADLLNNGSTHLRAALDVTEKATTLEGDTHVSGAALRDVIQSEVATYRVTDDGHISTDVEDRVEERHTDWTAVPGEVAVVGSSSGEFAFHLMSLQLAGRISRAEIDLESFAEDDTVDVASFSQTGFYRSGAGGSSQYVTATGGDHADMWEEEVHPGAVNQLRATVSARSAGLVECYVAESGYVAIDNPSDIGTGGFLQFVMDCILPHTRAPEEGQ